MDRNFVGPFGRSKVKSWPSIASNLYGPCQPSFSRYTRTSLYNGSDDCSLVVGPFRVLIASLTWRLALYFRRALIVFAITSARFSVDGNGGESRLMRGYAPNTSNVGTRPSGPEVSLTALTAICKIASSLKIVVSSACKISNARRRGP